MTTGARRVKEPTAKPILTKTGVMPTGQRVCNIPLFFNKTCCYLLIQFVIYWLGSAWGQESVAGKDWSDFANDGFTALSCPQCGCVGGKENSHLQTVCLTVRNIMIKFSQTINSNCMVCHGSLRTFPLGTCRWTFSIKSIGQWAVMSITRFSSRIHTLEIIPTMLCKYFGWTI